MPMQRIAKEVGNKASNGRQGRDTAKERGTGRPSAGARSGHAAALANQVDNLERALRASQKRQDELDLQLKKAKLQRAFAAARAREKKLADELKTEKVDSFSADEEEEEERGLEERPPPPPGKRRRTRSSSSSR